MGRRIEIYSKGLGPINVVTALIKRGHGQCSMNDQI